MTNGRMLDRVEVTKLTSLDTAEINAAIAGAGFPRPVMESGKLLWHESEVLVWLALPRSTRRYVARC